MPRRRYSEADLRAMIPLYLDGALDSAEREAVEAYWAAHPEALAEFAASTRLIDVLDEAVTAPPAPSDFTAEVMRTIGHLGWFARLKEAAGLHPPLDRVRWLTEAALLLLLGFLLFTHPWAPSVEPIELQLHGSERWAVDRPTSLRLVARDRTADKPLISGDVTVRLQGQRVRVTVFRGRTNEQGTVDAALHLPENLVPGRYTVVAEVAAPAGRALVWHPVHVSAPARVSITPVRPTVAVGDELVARVVAREADGRPLARTVDWRLTDRHGTTLAGGRKVSVPGGQVFVRAPISEAAAVGDATLWAGTGGVMTPAAVRLAPAARQDLAVAIEPEAKALALGQTVRGAVEVTTDSGVPVADAQVALRLEDAVGRRIERSVTVNAAGRAEFRIPTRSLRLGPVILRADARTVDEQGGAAALRLSLAETAAGVWIEDLEGAVGGLANRVRLRIDRPAGRPWSGTAALALNGERLSEVRVRDGHAALRLTPRTGWNRLRVSLAGAPATQSITFRAADPRQALRVEPLQTTAEPGAEVLVQVAAASRVNRVYLDLLQDGALLATRSLSPTGGRGLLVLRLPPQLRGDCWLYAYAPAGQRWLVGQAALRIEVPPGASLAVVEQSEGQGLTVTTSEPARLLVAATRPPAAEVLQAERAPVDGFLGYTLNTNSVPVAQRRAVEAQRRFFDQAPVLGAVIAALILIALTAWLGQQFSDPLEVVSRAERRRWGRVPQVHRRGTWAGLGALAVGLGLAGIVAGGLSLAGHQARELASATGPAARYAGPPPMRPARRTALLARAMARRATPTVPAPELARETLLFVDTPTPALPTAPAARWAIEAQALTAAGQALEEHVEVTRAGELAVRLAAPTELRIGELVTVPVIVANPTPEPLPLAVTATATSGLELTVAPTQRVIVAARSELTIGVGVRAAEYGDCQLTVEAEGRETAAQADAAISVLPDAPRVRRVWTGWIDRDADFTIDFPTGASARKLQVECLQEPLQIWITALEIAASRPCTDLIETAAAADARSLILRLGRDSERLSAAEAEAREVALQEAMQRLLSYAVRRPDGSLDGSFARQPGGRPELHETAWALLVLRRIDHLTPVDSRLLQRSRAWLREASRNALARTPPPVPTEQTPAPEAASLALAALALTNGAAADQEVVDAVLDHLAARIGLLQDTATLAQVADAMGYERPRAAATEEVLARLATLRNQRPDGSNWYPGAAPTLAGATGRGAALEVTARAVLAFGRAAAFGSARREGLAYLAAQQQDDGTWGDAFLTSLVVRAQMAGRELPVPARGFVSASLDGQRLGRATYDGVRDDLVVKQSPEPGQHLLRLRFLGRGRAAYRVTMAYTLSGPVTISDGLQAAVDAPTVRATPEGRLAFDVTVSNPGAVPVAGVVAELAVPAGFAVAGSPDAGPVLQLPCGTLQPGASRTVTVRLRATAPAAQLAARPITVRALRDPSRSARTVLPGLRIS